MSCRHFFFYFRIILSTIVEIKNVLSTTGIYIKYSLESTIVEIKNVLSTNGCSIKDTRNLQ